MFGFIVVIHVDLYNTTVLLLDQLLFTLRATQLCASCNLLKMTPFKIWVHFKNPPSFTRPLRENKTPGEKPKESTLRGWLRAVWIRSPVASQIAVVITSRRGFTWWHFVHGADISRSYILAGVHSTERRLADFSILPAPGYRAGQKIIPRQLPYVVIVPQHLFWHLGRLT